MGYGLQLEDIGEVKRKKKGDRIYKVHRATQQGGASLWQLLWRVQFRQGIKAAGSWVANQRVRGWTLR